MPISSSSDVRTSGKGEVVGEDEMGISRNGDVGASGGGEVVGEDGAGGVSVAEPFCEDELGVTDTEDVDVEVEVGEEVRELTTDARIVV